MKSPDKENRPNWFFRLIQNHYSVTPKVKSESVANREKWLVPRLLKFNRWALMPAAFVIQFCCGSLYSWSVFNKPIDLLIYGENRNMAPITFYIAVGFLGGAAALMGPWLERHGPFVTCALGTTLFFIGNMISGLALHLRFMWLLFIGYGFFCGFGIGMCYISPVSALQKWFPDRRGLAAGFAVCGFGAGSIVFSKVQLPLLHLVGLPVTFVILGSVYFLCMIISATVLRTPPTGYQINVSRDPETEMESTDLSVFPKESTSNTEPTMTLIQALTSTDFRLLMVMFTANIIFGLVLVSRLSNIITDVFGKSAEEASTIVAINGGFNLGGRLAISVTSDYVGRKHCFFFMLSLQVLILGSFSTMTNSAAYIPFIITMWIVTGCYGAAFGVLPALLSDKFGTNNIGACHGIVLTGWSFAGIAGGLVFTSVFHAVLPANYVPSNPHPYNINVWWIFGIVCIGWCALLFLRPTPQDERVKAWFKRWFKFNKTSEVKN